MTLNQYDGDSGDPMVMLLNRKHWVDPVTEVVKLDSTEIWELVNLTDDTHPIHLHLVRFQILDRQPIAVEDFLLGDEKASSTPPAPSPRHPRTSSAGRTSSSAPPARSPASSSRSTATPAATSGTATSSSTRPTT